MALFSLKILPAAPAAALPLRFSPPAVALSQIHHRPLLSRTSLLSGSCPPRSSLSQNHQTGEPDEDSFENSEPSTENEAINSSAEFNFNESKMNSSAISPNHPSVANGALDSSSLASPFSGGAAAQVEHDRQQQQLRETLAGLSQVLELLSSTLSEVSSAVRVLSASVGANPSQTEKRLSPLELRDKRDVEARERSLEPLNPPEPWDNTPNQEGIGSGVAAADGESSRSEDDVVPPYLVEQSIQTHKLAYKLQQSFFQARIEGLGKPFQVAAEEFVDACMDAHALGVGLKELQLQLVLQDGALTGAFAIRNQRWSNDPIINEESRIRSLWVRLVYSTLSQLEPTVNKEEEDPTDLFVRQVLQLAFEKGFDLERIKLEQTFAGEDTSGAVKAMRENQYLILLTLEKAKSLNK